MRDMNGKRRHVTGLARLIMAVATIASVWLLLLPQLALRDPLKTHLQWLETRRIDPSAMYYTELEAMDPILERLENRRRGR